MKYLHRLFFLPPFFLASASYLIIFFGAIFEAVPFLGLVIPGQSIVIIGGFLAKEKVINLFAAIFLAATGAIIGDFTGYFLGKKYGYNFFEKYRRYFFLKKKYLEGTQRLMQNHTGKSLILGRFNSLTRAFAPFVAGASQVPESKFWPYNILGGFSWATTFVLVGYLFGESYEIASRYIGRFIFWAILLSIVIFYLYKWVGRQKSAFLKSYFSLLLLSIFSLFLFCWNLEKVARGKKIILDQILEKKIALCHTHFLTVVLAKVTFLFAPFHLLAIGLLLVAFLAWRRQYFFALLEFFSLTTIVAIIGFLKFWLKRPRPEPFFYITAHGYSFPSAHATMSALFFVSLIYLSRFWLKKGFWREIFISINIFFIFLVSFSRLYFQVHWFSDVLAGMALGIFWFSFVLLLFRAGELWWQNLKEKERERV